MNEKWKALAFRALVSALGAAAAYLSMHTIESVVVSVLIVNIIQAVLNSLGEEGGVTPTKQTSGVKKWLKRF